MSLRKMVGFLALVGLVLSLTGCSPAEKEFLQIRAEQMNWPGVSGETEFKISLKESDGDYSAGYTLNLKSQVDLKNGGMQMMVKGVSDFPYYPSLDSIAVYLDPEGCFYVAKSGFIKFLDMTYETEMAAALAKIPGDYLYFELEELMQDFPLLLSSGFNFPAWSRQSIESMGDLAELGEVMRDFSLGLTRDGNAFRLKIDASNAENILKGLGRMVTDNYEELIEAMPWPDHQKELLLNEAYYVKQSFNEASLQEIYRNLFVDTNLNLGLESVNPTNGYQDYFWVKAHDDSMQFALDLTSKGTKLTEADIVYPAKVINGVEFIEEFYGYSGEYYDDYEDVSGGYQMAAINIDTKLMECQLGLVPVDIRMIDGQIYIAALDLAGILYEELYWDEQVMKVYSYYGEEVYLDGVLLEAKGHQVYYVKLREIEQLGYYLQWNEAAREVEIGY